MLCFSVKLPTGSVNVYRSENRVAPEVEEAVVEFAFAQPAYGQVRAANELRKRGIFVSPGGVLNIW